MTRPLPLPPDTPPGFPNWESLMRVALKAAQEAVALEEVPVGAAVVSADGTLLATACNAPVTSNDPTGHAEIRCLRAAAIKARNYRLPGVIMAVTLEPCMMCAGALVQARVAGVVFGAPDPKAGALLSQIELPALRFLNHQYWIIGNVLRQECSDLLRDFFQQRRTTAPNGEAFQIFNNE